MYNGALFAVFSARRDIVQAAYYRESDNEGYKEARLYEPR